MKRKGRKAREWYLVVDEKGRAYNAAPWLAAIHISAFRPRKIASEMLDAVQSRHRDDDLNFRVIKVREVLPQRKRGKG